MPELHYRACHLCEAICGLEITTEGQAVVAIKGDKLDPLSKGFICPKAVALQDIHTDPNRIRAPLKKVDGQWQSISWAQAISYTAERLHQLQLAHGDDAVAVYAGNPSVHSHGTWLYSSLVSRALATKNRYSATSVDQLPHHLASLLMYGHWLRLPVVDIDNTQWLMILGANPLASNGSLLTAPDMPGRLKALRARGGKLIVVDPRKTETAYKADQYLAMPPGKDIYLLLAMLNYLFASDQCHPGHLQPLLRGLDTLKAALSGFTPALAQEQTGIDAATICAITDELVREPKAAVYGRMGVSTQIHGSLCHWAIQLLNLLTGHLDVEGGTLLANPAVDAAGPSTNPQSYGRFHSRVRGLPEFGGEFPAATLADEMQQEGEGQVKALLTIAGNPVLSTPNGRRLDQALSELDFMVAVDFYINETTRHADIILPPVSPLERDNYDITFNMLSVHNTAKYSPAVFAKDGDALHDWQIFVKLAEAINELKQKPAKKTAAPAQMLDQMLQAGPYQLSLQQLIDNPHGIDLGPLRPRMLEVISPQQGIQLAPELLIDALADVPMSCQPAEAEFMLIGRRHIRSNNSWMHNFHRLVKGKDRHQLQMHSDDIKRRGFTNGGKVEVRSRIGKVEVELLACDDVSPGVVSLPHGFGHNRKNMRLDIATQHAGTSANDLTDQLRIDSVSGNAAINGVPVWIDAVG